MKAETFVEASLSKERTIPLAMAGRMSLVRPQARDRKLWFPTLEMIDTIILLLSGVSCFRPVIGRAESGRAFRLAWHKGVCVLSTVAPALKKQVRPSNLVLTYRRRNTWSSLLI